MERFKENLRYQGENSVSRSRKRSARNAVHPSASNDQYRHSQDGKSELVDDVEDGSGSDAVMGDVQSLTSTLSTPDLSAAQKHGKHKRVKVRSTRTLPQSTSPNKGSGEEHRYHSRSHSQQQAWKNTVNKFKPGRSQRVHPLPLVVTGRQPHGVARQVQQELTWMDTPYGVQLTSVRPTYTPSLLPQPSTHLIPPPAPTKYLLPTYLPVPSQNLLPPSYLPPQIFTRSRDTPTFDSTAGSGEHYKQLHTKTASSLQQATSNLPENMYESEPSATNVMEEEALSPTQLKATGVDVVDGRGKASSEIRSTNSGENEMHEDKESSKEKQDREAKKDNEPISKVRKLNNLSSEHEQTEPSGQSKAKKRKGKGRTSRLTTENQSVIHRTTPSVQEALDEVSCVAVATC